VRKPEGKKTTVKTWHRQEDNIKIGLNETGRQGMNWKVAVSCECSN
jgi:hypothetical protein